MLPEQEQELNDLRNFKTLVELREFKKSIELAKTPSNSEILFDRAQQFRQMAVDVEGAVNSTITRIAIVYIDKMINIPVDVPELAVLYDEALRNVVIALNKHADEYTVHANREAIKKEEEKNTEDN